MSLRPKEQAKGSPWGSVVDEEGGVKLLPKGGGAGPAGGRSARKGLGRLRLGSVWIGSGCGCGGVVATLEGGVSVPLVVDWNLGTRLWWRDAGDWPGVVWVSAERLVALSKAAG